MRKRRNNRKKLFITLFIVVSVMIVGYAFLSSTLQLFGGLTVIGGNNWGVKWDNIKENDDSTAIVNEHPILIEDDTKVSFQVTLNQPGDFYEFTVDAVNTGTIDAMIDDISYNIYNQDDDIVDLEFLNYSVIYESGGDLEKKHLLKANSRVTYKVRLEFRTDISADDLPQGEEAYRFEFGITYVQADDNAYSPTDRIENAILIGDVSGISSSSMRDVFSDNYDILYTVDEDFVNSAAGAVSFETQANVKSLVEEYGANNVVIILGHGEGEAAGIAAETFTIGDPTLAGPLAGVSLHTPVYHIVEPELLLHCDEELYESLITPFLMTVDDESIIEEVKTFREQHSVPHSL